MSRRTNCVICNDTLNAFYIRIGFPVSMSPPDESADVLSDQEFGSCSSCGCVQLMSLIEPIVLYRNNHNETYNTPTWKQHHSTFADFIINNDVGSDVIEIGGTPATLYPFLTHLNYNIMNICHQETNEVPFILGNCETYTFDNRSDLVLSHVFEHLYNPRKFIENIESCGVKRVFISIPNMDVQLKAKSPYCVSNEHTFFVNYGVICRLFGQCGYKCKSFVEFKNHSYFFMFELGSSVEYQDNTDTQSYLDAFKDIFETANLRFEKNISDKYEVSFIAPGGHFGQLVHYYMQPKSLTGFLDNDVTKQYKRVYGTNYTVFPYDKLKEYKGQRIRIFLYGGPYVQELREQILSYNDVIVDIIEL